MNFSEKIASYVLGFLMDSALPDIALTALTEQMDSDALRILAGMSPSDNPFELRMYFTNALAEIHRVLPEKKEAIEIYIKYVIKKINHAYVSIYEGFCEIDGAVDVTPYYYDDWGLMECYADYLQIREIKIGGTEYYPADFDADKYVAEKERSILQKLNVWVAQDLSE